MLVDFADAGSATSDMHACGDLWVLRAKLCGADPDADDSLVFSSKGRASCED